MSDQMGAPVVRSESHGPHWVAWVPDERQKPRDSVVLVGRTQEEAEERARQWARKLVGGA